ncbi:MAG: DUF2071 domain-containing protein [Terrimonas sp.]|nr:DUF2071 domain-containing protein [Terrimonas sp.]
MNTRNIFLTAAWKNLVMANYRIDPSLLLPFVPTGTELDTWQDDYYISLVGFMFEQVRLKGMRIPFHENFPEVNLRFYVRYKDEGTFKRGVVFISEIVPKPAISALANILYKEHYRTMPMRHSLRYEGDQILLDYQWKKQDWNNILVKASSKATALAAQSAEEFITEHFWGYARKTNDRTVEYHVSHPRWDIHPVISYQIDCDFAGLYGKSFGFLREQDPHSVFLAAGSAVKIFDRRIL